MDILQSLIRATKSTLPSSVAASLTEHKSLVCEGDAYLSKEGTAPEEEKTFVEGEDDEGTRG